jgi:hypothetical protein
VFSAAQAKVETLRKHITSDCQAVPAETRAHWQARLAGGQGDSTAGEDAVLAGKKRKGAQQTDIRRRFASDKLALTKEENAEVGSHFLRYMVCSNIPFAAVNSPHLAHALQISWHTPSGPAEEAAAAQRSSAGAPQQEAGPGDSDVTAEELEGALQQQAAADQAEKQAEQVHVPEECRTSWRAAQLWSMGVEGADLLDPTYHETLLSAPQRVIKEAAAGVDPAALAAAFIARQESRVAAAAAAADDDAAQQ